MFPYPFPVHSPGTPRPHSYLVPTLEWSQTGITVAEPDGIVVTQECRQWGHHDAFAYLKVSPCMP